MRYTPSPNLLDWVSSTLRWLILFGLTISLAISGSLSPAVEITLLVSAAWSLLLTALAALAPFTSLAPLTSVASFGRRFAWRSYVIVGVDALFAGLLFYFSGGLGGSCEWAGLLPVASAALYFLMRGAVIASLAFTLIQAAISLTEGDITTVALALVPLGLFYLVFGLLLGYVSSLMRGIIEQRQEEALAARREVATGRARADTLAVQADLSPGGDVELPAGAGYGHGYWLQHTGHHRRRKRAHGQRGADVQPG